MIAAGLSAKQFGGRDAQSIAFFTTPVGGTRIRTVRSFNREVKEVVNIGQGVFKEWSRLGKEWSEIGRGGVRDWSKRGQGLVERGVRERSKSGQRLTEVVRDWQKNGQRLVEERSEIGRRVVHGMSIFCKSQSKRQPCRVGMNRLRLKCGPDWVTTPRGREMKNTKQRVLLWRRRLRRL
jgi:hypothetical protein